MSSRTDVPQREKRGARFQRAIDRYIGIPLVFLLAALRRKRSAPLRIGKIGLASLGAIGDTVLLTAVINDIRVAMPNARLVLLISHSNRGLAPLLAGADEIVVLPILRPLECARLLRSYQFDVLADFTQWPRISALYAALSGARFTIGFAVSRQHRDKVFDAAVPHNPRCHELENFRALTRAIGVTPTTSLPEIRIPPAAAQSVAVAAGRPFVVFHPWASGFKGWLREWTSEGYVQLAREITAWGYQVIITGSPVDVPKTRALVAEAAHAGVSMLPVAGRFTLAETAALLARADLVVSVSTGIAHVAAAIGAPQISLYGPTNPALWRPLSDRTVIVAASGVHAGYLYLGFEYPANAENCTASIAASDVISAARQMLSPRGDVTRELALRLSGETAVGAASGT